MTLRTVVSTEAQMSSFQRGRTDPCDPRIPMSAATEDRARALAQLAAGVAHEINNPAAYVLTNLEHLRDSLGGYGRPPDPSQWEEALRVIDESIEGVRRITGVVVQLQAFLQNGSEELQAVDLNETVRSVTGIVAPTLRARARVELELEELPVIACYRYSMAQVILQLLLNAAQACDEEEREDNVVRVSTRVTSSGIEVCISDTGCGIKPADTGRIFEPFFTTKPLTENSGLGLAVSRATVESLGGKISFVTREGMGTTFRVTLPIGNPPLEESRSSDVLPIAPAVRPRVLLIEDEPGIRRALTRVLRANTDVITAKRGDEAIQKLTKGLEVEVIVCDLLLPGATGMDVHAYIERHRPELLRRLLFVTGGATSPKTRDFAHKHRDALLLKPIDARRLQLVIDSVAGGTSVRRALRATEPEPTSHSTLPPSR
jgi:nitrogen-specific signal transduction histidine kinase/CheY-like chemotaxis protein